ncbi:hypothetical protein C0995_003743 [Termitomyces sp. Mi166|nr:hypothetical protein C0995_003743 [Termitomyces sp. Mi166\
MFPFASFVLAVTAVSSVSGLVAPRATPPAGWATKYLEATQDAVTALPASCASALSVSALSASSTLAATPAPTPFDDGQDDDCEDEDEDEDDIDDDDEECDE